MTLKEQILELRSQGLSYRQIAIQIPCSKGTICYYLADGQKDKTSVRQRKNRAKQHSYVKKIESFSNSKELVDLIPKGIWHLESPLGGVMNCALLKLCKTKKVTVAELNSIIFNLIISLKIIFLETSGKSLIKEVVPFKLEKS